jgi:NAD(P)-dependent dehydrogenase (short-subunit alcohol dehydrogenase family)
MGARVAMLARDERELERGREDLRRRGFDALVVKCDVRDRAQAEAAVRTVTQELGAPSVLINNAGLITVGPMETMTQDDYEDGMRTHFWGPLFMTLAVLPEMRKNRRGRIVNISSFGGKVATPHMMPYAASKYALVGLSEAMRAERSARAEEQAEKLAIKLLFPMVVFIFPCMFIVILGPAGIRIQQMFLGG